MELHVVINGRKDLAGQLYKQLRGAIESGGRPPLAQLNSGLKKLTSCYASRCSTPTLSTKAWNRSNVLDCGKTSTDRSS